MRYLISSDINMTERVECADANSLEIPKIN